MNWDKKDIIYICRILAFGIILYWLLQNLGIIGNTFKNLCDILSPFIIGGAIAFVVNIPMTLLESRQINFKKVKGKKTRRIVFEKNIFSDRKIPKARRLFSILLSLIIIFLIIVGIIFLIIPELLKVLTNIINYIPQILNNIKELATHLIEEHPEVADIITNIQINLESFSKEMVKELTTVGTSLVTSSFGVITSTISFVLNLVLAIIFAIYI